MNSNGSVRGILARFPKDVIDTFVWECTRWVVGHSFEEISHDVIGLAIDLHRQLGPGFVESIYHRALLISLEQAGIEYRSQVPVEVFFRGVPVGLHRIDVVVADQIILELKSSRRLLDVHFSQIRSYLRASGLKVGLLFNFNAPALVVKRIIPRSCLNP